MKNFLLCCVFAVSFFLVESAKEKVASRGAGGQPLKFKSYAEHFQNGARNHHFDHLAILGSKKVEEEFDEMEPEEAKTQLRKLIPKMDLNGDGNLQLEELQSWIFNSYKAIDKEEANEEFKSVDLDGDEKIKWDEYLKKVFSYTTNDLDKLKEKNAEEWKEIEKMISADKEKFQQADVKKDDVLDKEEFQAFVHPHDHEHMHELEIKHALADRDKNKDGKIDLEEYKGDLPEHSDETEKLAEETKFKDYDKNNDGFLEKKELIDWILPNTMQNAKEEAHHLKDEADDNKDNVLSEEEILNHHETFVGSQATDYGRHLHLIKDEL